MSILGVNIGTTHCSAAVYETDGTLVCQGVQGYPLTHPAPGAIELDAEHVMRSVRAAIVAAMGGLHDRDAVTAMSFSVQGEAVTPVDQTGHVLAPTLTTFDRRPEAEAACLEDRMGREWLQQITGLPLHAMFSLPKMLWWQRRHPDWLKRTTRFLCFGGLFLQRLGLEPVMDYSLGGRTLAMDLREKRWSGEILEAVGLDVNLLPHLQPTGKVLGTIPERIARKYGLPAGVKVVLGGYDQACAALGCGVIQAGEAMDATSAVECLVASIAEPVINDAMLQGGYGCSPHVVPNRYITLAYNFTGGSLLRWYRDIFGDVEAEEARVSGLHFFEILVGKASTGPSPVLVLPHFATAGTPWLDVQARGAIVGLTLTTTKAEIIKGMLDGLAYEMRLNLERLAQAGVGISQLRIIGGGSSSPTWLQLKANIYHRPVSGSPLADAATRGAAMLAGIGTGIYRDYEEAAHRFAPSNGPATPQADEIARYDEMYRQYQRLYPALRTLEEAPS